MDLRWVHQRIALEGYKVEFILMEGFRKSPMDLVVRLLLQHRCLCRMAQVELDHLRDRLDLEVMINQEFNWHQKC